MRFCRADNFDANMRLAGVLKELAVTAGCTPAQSALAWSLAQSSVQGIDIVPIPGTRCVTNLEQNLAAGSLEIAPSLLRQLDQALPRGATTGPRYTATMERLADRRTGPR